MVDEDVFPLFRGLYQDFLLDPWSGGQKPLLAHYTSIQVAEKILKEEEVWLSNPLFMNDIDEIRFGINAGAHSVLQNDALIPESMPKDKIHAFRDSYSHYYKLFSEEHAIDVFAFCLSEHEPSDKDGRLSMWRAYGAQGNGAAIVFDTNRIGIPSNTPLIMSKVRYETGENRLKWIEQKIGECYEIISRTEIAGGQMWIPAHFLFEVVKLFSLTSKHPGFSEELEWRVFYLPERDEGKILSGSISHIISSRGVEPKMKLKIAPIASDLNEDWTFSDIFHRLILGPGISSPLAKKSVERMLGNIGKSHLRDRVLASTIPFRPPQIPQST